MIGGGRLGGYSTVSHLAIMAEETSGDWDEGELEQASQDSNNDNLLAGGLHVAQNCGSLPPTCKCGKPEVCAHPELRMSAEHLHLPNSSKLGRLPTLRPVYKATPQRKRSENPGRSFV